MNSQKVKLEHYLDCLRKKHAVLEAELSKLQSCRGCGDEAKRLKWQKCRLKRLMVEVEHALKRMSDGEVIPWPVSARDETDVGVGCDDSIEQVQVV